MFFILDIDFDHIFIFISVLTTYTYHVNKFGVACCEFFSFSWTGFSGAEPHFRIFAEI